MTNVEFHLQLNHNDTWNMSRLHFHDHFELLLPLTSPGNIFVNDRCTPFAGAPCTSLGRTPSTDHGHRGARQVCPPHQPVNP